VWLGNIIKYFRLLEQFKEKCEAICAQFVDEKLFQKKKKTIETSSELDSNMFFGWFFCDITKW
jgi:hypothetical protein